MNYKFKNHTLSNGVKVHLFVNKDMKQVFFSYFVNYGSNQIYRDFNLNGKEYHVLPGIAHFLEHTLLGKSRYGDIFDLFSERDYTKNGSTNINRTYYFFYGVKDVIDSIKKLILAIDTPVFTKEDIDKERNPIIEETKRTTNNYNFMTIALAINNTYKNINIFANSLNTIGSEEDNKNISYDMLKTCYDAFYRDNNKEIVVGGNINEKDMLDYLESIYKDIPKHQSDVKLIISQNLEDIKIKEDEIILPINDDIVSISNKIKVNKKSDILKTCEYLNFINKNLFVSYANFIQELINDRIIFKTPYIDITKCVDNYINNTIIFLTKDANKLKEKLKDVYMNFKFDVNDFELYKKERIAGDLKQIDFIYNGLKSYAGNDTEFNSLIDVDFLKNLKYEDFLDFYNTTSFDNYSIAIAKGKK